MNWDAIMKCRCELCLRFALSSQNITNQTILFSMDINDARGSLMVNSSGRAPVCVRHEEVLEKIVVSVNEM